MLNLLTVTNIFCRLPVILFIASKKGMPHSQTVRLNRIFFDETCSDLEKYLLERGYSEKMVRKKILRAKAIPRDALLEKVNNQDKPN